ncbi:MAG: response regulator transcription factor [Granulosicoccus sp.]
MDDETQRCFTVLLVDDDIDVLASNARYMRLSGLDVQIANNADVALHRLGQLPVDAIVTDLRMPDKDGLEFASNARMLCPMIPIVFFSGFATVPDVVAAMRLGAVDFLEKPVDPATLLATVEGIRDRYESAINTAQLSFDSGDNSVPFRYRVLAFEKLLIEQSLIEHDGDIASVLAALKINRRTLNDKMRRLDIKR